MPAALFVTVGVLIFGNYFTFLSNLHFLDIKDFDSGKWFLFAAFVSWAAFCLYSISDWTIRLYEGYFFPLPIRQLLTDSIRKKWHKKNTTNIKALNLLPREKKYILERANYVDGALLEYANFGNLAPVDERLLLPTKFGNIMRACELYPNDRYEIRGIAVWSRILQVFPKHFKDQLEEKNNQMIFLLNSSLLSYLIGSTALLFGLFNLFSAVGFGYLHQIDVQKLLSSTDAISSLNIVTIGFLFIFIGFLLYTVALPVAEGFGALIRTGYDLYRFELLRQLNQPIPANDTEESHTWKKISELFIAGKNLGIEALSIKYNVRNDLLDFTDLEEYKKNANKKSCWLKRLVNKLPN
jgi:hypothetical protein